MTIICLYAPSTRARTHYSFSIRFIEPSSLLSGITQQSKSAATIPAVSDEAPPGTVKSILPCTPLAIVKCLENIGVYNTILKYGDRAYGKIITVINRFVSFDIL